MAALILLLMPTLTAATEYRRGAGQYTTYGGYEGVDGYVRQSGIIMPQCDGHFVLSWLDVDHRTSVNQAWVQIGQHQGSFLNWPLYNCDASDVRMYAELQDCGDSARCWYWKADIGKPPKPNYPLYVSRTGWYRNNDHCSVTGTSFSYEWAFRVGSFTSSPKTYGWLTATNGNANAQQEIYWNTGSPDNINQNRWGLNDYGNVQSGYGMSLYQYPGQAWSAWSSSVSTQVFHDPALTIYQPSSYQHLAMKVWD